MIETGEVLFVNIRNTLSYNLRANFSNEIENIFLDIIPPETKVILIGVVYRRPDQPNVGEKFSEAIFKSTN